ncbi:hypothetical protein C2I18_25205 [Paenibacillus sp. PK3_47]|uniref:hypothetical protein n=1 Tax=Paenibacillus sp. PK3_47 TaxID=2072642 RepID=UPI00201E11B7|nr:hypothetical protein [Paenibacillus sp. PK3_47]UQZ36543.1 hypothetical protein C2I18_25205 [Paenibacillus sp. PK3_47]
MFLRVFAAVKVESAFGVRRAGVMPAGMNGKSPVEFGGIRLLAEMNGRSPVNIAGVGYLAGMNGKSPVEFGEIRLLAEMNGKSPVEFAETRQKTGPKVK